MFALKPGARSPLIALNDILRDQHEEMRVAVDRLIEDRRKNSVPLDDSTDWSGEIQRVVRLTGCARAQDTAGYRDELAAALAATSGALTPMAAYVPDPDIADVKVSMRLVSKALLLESRALLAEVAYKGEDASKAFMAQAAQGPGLRKLVAQAVAEVVGLEDADGPLVIRADGDAPLSDAALDVLDVNGLLVVLFSAAREYQSLRPTERARFGSRAPSTSATSSASAAPPACAPSSGATAAGHALSFAAPSTRPTGVLDDTCSITPSSGTSSSFTAPPMEGTSAQAVSI